MTSSDVVTLPWQAVRDAYGLFVYDVKEGLVSWLNATKLYINRLGTSQVAMVNAQSVSSREIFLVLQ